MTWTAEDAIKRARDTHPAFDDRQTPDGPALRKLDSYHKELYGKAVDREPDLFSATTTIQFPLTDFEAGEALPADFDRPLDGEIHFSGTDTRQKPLNFIPFRSRHQPGSPWPAYILEGQIHFVGSETDWEPVDKVVVYYIPTPTELVAVDTQADLPDRALPVLSERLALFMAARGPQDGEGTGIDIGFTAEDWAETERQFLHEVASGRSKAESGVVREVW